MRWWLPFLGRSTSADLSAEPLTPDPSPVPWSSTDPAPDLPDDREGRLEVLVRWLATPYGTNRPVFAVELPDGRPLLTGRVLAALYEEIVPGTEPFPGVWVMCPSCGHWGVTRKDT